MNRLSIKQWLICLPFVFLGAVLIGCGGPEQNTDEVEKYWSSNEQFGGGGIQGTVMKPVESKGTGTIEGVVTINGNIPSQDDLRAKMQMHGDAPICLSPDAPEADKTAYTWVIDKSSKAVANVVVFVKPLDEKKTFFNVSSLVSEKKGYKTEQKIDQPYCAFDPHLIVTFPKYIDPDDPGTRLRPNFLSSEQKVLVANSATINHNAAYSGAGASGNQTLSPGAQPLQLGEQMFPTYREPVSVKCSIHGWMQGYVWAFPHPFATKTDAKGKFKIENVPAGTKIRLVAWHEAGGFFLEGGVNGEEIEVEDGKIVTKNLTINP